MEQWIKLNATDLQVKAFYRINPKYGAARADYFRYLLLYHVGGIYLDIKSTCLTRFENIIRENDEFLYSKWPMEENGKRKFGRHFKLLRSNLDEIQQWFIISKPKSPLLSKVIDEVTANLVREKSNGIRNFGREGVLETTGPIVYTLALAKVLPFYRAREISSVEEGLIYKISGIENIILQSPRLHYSQLMDPIVEIQGSHFLHSANMNRLFWTRKYFLSNILNFQRLFQCKPNL